MKISFDLDSVIFDIEPLYIQANKEFGVEYKRNWNWDLDECYPPQVVARLIELFKDDSLYTMPLISQEYPVILNNLLRNPKYEVSFVTQRRLQQPEKSFAQLRNAGINCKFSQVYDRKQPKVEVLKEIGTELHFDDGPHVVSDCLRESVNVAMISNDTTLYNHFLRDRVQHFSDLKTALIKTGIITR